MQKWLQPVKALGWCLLIALVCFLIGRYPQDLFPAGPFEHEVDSLNFWYVIGAITDGVQWVLCFAAGWILAGKTGAAAKEYSRLWNGLLLGGSLVVLLLGMPELVGALTVLTPDYIGGVCSPSGCMAAVGEIRVYQRDQSGRAAVLLALLPRVFFENQCPKKPWVLLNTGPTFFGVTRDRSSPQGR